MVSISRHRGAHKSYPPNPAHPGHRPRIVAPIPDQRAHKASSSPPFLRCWLPTLLEIEMDIIDDRQDERIRTALRNADKKGKLGVVAAVTGIAGGEAELRRIMNSHDALSIMDRGMLAIHLEE